MTEMPSTSGSPTPDEPEGSQLLSPEQETQLRDLIERHLPSLHGVVARIVRRFPRYADAEDLLQELLIRLLDAPRRGVLFENDDHFLRYAAQTARNLFVDQYRRRSVRKHHSLEVDENESDSQAVPSGEISPLDRLLALETDKKLQDLFDRALQTLPDERMQQFMTLHYQGGRSLDELTDEMKISRATAYNWVARFRSALRQAIQGETEV